jgi:hypothetical protein
VQISKPEIWSGAPDPSKNLLIAAGYPQPVRPELDPNNLVDRALISLGRSAGFLDDHKERGAPIQRADRHRQSLS